MWIGETRNDYRYDNTMFWISFFVMTASLIMIYFSSRKNLLIANYNQYYDMIYQNEMFTISALAEYSDKPREQVVQELQLLISQGYLKNIRVSQTENEIAGAFVTTVKEQVKRKTVRCGGCGATNEVAEHVTTECEYCGRKLTFHNH